VDRLGDEGAAMIKTCANVQIDIGFIYGGVARNLVEFNAGFFVDSLHTDYPYSELLVHIPKRKAIHFLGG